MRKFSTFLFLIVLFTTCKKEQESIDDDKDVSHQDEVVYVPTIPDDCRSSIMDQGKVYIKDNKKWLYGGRDSTWNFDITQWELSECQLRFGIGREAFKALIKPVFVSIGKEDQYYDDKDRFILIETETEGVKAYSINLLTIHEVVNDVVDGNPVAVAYCILADLGAVYTRIYHGREFTFALSGYTYHDDEVWGGLDAFVFWDRETESLWWPLIDKAVSGLMQKKNTQLEKYNGEWREVTWKDIKENYSTAQVLARGQIMNVPQNWERYTEEDFK